MNVAHSTGQITNLRGRRKIRAMAISIARRTIGCRIVSEAPPPNLKFSGCISSSPIRFLDSRGSLFSARYHIPVVVLIVEHSAAQLIWSHPMVAGQFCHVAGVVELVSALEQRRFQATQRYLRHFAIELEGQESWLEGHATNHMIIKTFNVDLDERRNAIACGQLVKSNDIYFHGCLPMGSSMARRLLCRLVPLIGDCGQAGIFDANEQLQFSRGVTCGAIL